MRISFFINIWLSLKNFLNKIFCFQEVFAYTANTSNSVFNESTIIWEQKNSILTSKYLHMTMHVAPSKNKTFVWQLGNDKYFERGFFENIEDAKEFVLKACVFYIQWEKNNLQKSYFTDGLWKTDNNDGFVATWGGYDFWISPVLTETTDTLWRYDVYRDGETKCIQTGVCRDMDYARNACIRIVEMQTFQQNYKDHN